MANVRKFDVALPTGVSIQGGQATLAAGTVAVATGWTTVYSAACNWGETPTNEEPFLATISGGVVTFTTATTSTADIQYVIFGCP